MRRLIILAMALGAPTLAGAGELTRTAAGIDYAFVKCARPAEPDMTISARLQGRKLREAENARVRAYNVYIDGVNEYSECLAAEAKVDLEAYYAAVSDKLDAEHKAIAARADELRPSRGARKAGR